MKPTIDPPRCPLHSKPMQQLPALPELTIGRGVTEFKIKLRREFNAFRRFRCPVEGCSRVEAISTESTDESAD